MKPSEGPAAARANEGLCNFSQEIRASRRRCAGYPGVEPHTKWDFPHVGRINAVRRLTFLPSPTSAGNITHPVVGPKANHRMSFTLR